MMKDSPADHNAYTLEFSIHKRIAKTQLNKSFLLCSFCESGLKSFHIVIILNCASVNYMIEWAHGLTSQFYV